MPCVGYVNGLENSPWAFGLSFYAQGGMGATYDEVDHNTFAIIWTDNWSMLLSRRSTIRRLR
ncbi:MAG TPA: hypothetical protein ENH10_00375 [Bacteroidetes bacterium]|nr:hypothetical protein BMS3Bbin04_01121 [bacterium BMS3Bbin04]HDO64476.1 hypothetical protein [Bacteroidota bacterium]HEX03601.1 hypothetical protein [Bacteroidota bacterium]